MTITRRLVVDLADVQALRIVCARCKAALSLSLTETVRIPTNCPNCHDDWDDVTGVRNRSVDHLARALKAPAPAGTPFLVQLELPAE